MSNKVRNRLGQYELSKILNQNKYKISHGCDWLALTLDNREVLNALFSYFGKNSIPVDSDNANFNVIEIVGIPFSLTRIKTQTGISVNFAIVYNGISVSIFNINIHDEKTINFLDATGGKGIGVITFYGSFFRILLNVNNPFSGTNFLENLTNVLNGSSISRYDYRVDFFNAFEQIPNPEFFFTLRKNVKVKTYKKGDWLESWEMGNRENKTVFLRCYDKKLELTSNSFKTSLKGVYLYGDYLDYDTVFRLEYEFGKRQFSNFIFQGFDVVPYHVLNYIGGIAQIKNTYTFENKIDLSDQVRRLAYLRNFASMVKTLDNNGIDVLQEVAFLLSSNNN